MDITEVINKVNDGKIPVGYKKEHGYIVPIDWKVINSDKIFKNISIKNTNNKIMDILASTQDKGVILRKYLNKNIIYNDANINKYKKVKKGNFVISLRSFQGGIEYSMYDGIISPAYTILEKIKDINDIYYKIFFKSSDFIRRLNVAVYGIRDGKQISYSNFAEIYLPYPPLKEQENIAKILQCCNKIITLKEELLNEKEKYKKYVMGEILSGKKRLSGYTDKWKKSELHNLADLNSGGTPTTSHKEYYNGNIKWASISDITSQYKYIYDTKIKITELGLQNSSAKIFPKYTVLFAIYASIGECVITMDEIATSQAILGINCGKKLFYEYLFYVLLAKKNDYQIYAQKGTQSNLNKDIVANFIIFLPSYHEQQAIVNILTKVDNEIELLKKELELYKEKFKALSQILLTGIVRTNNLSEK